MKIGREVGVERSVVEALQTDTGLRMRAWKKRRPKPRMFCLHADVKICQI
jgi:hypothetical protein